MDIQMFSGITLIHHDEMIFNILFITGYFRLNNKWISGNQTICPQNVKQQIAEKSVEIFQAGAIGSTLEVLF